MLHLGTLQGRLDGLLGVSCIYLLLFMFLISIRSLRRASICKQGLFDILPRTWEAFLTSFLFPPPPETPTSSQGLLHYKHPGARVCGVWWGWLWGVWNLSEASGSAGEAISLGTFRSGF